MFSLKVSIKILILIVITISSKAIALPAIAQESNTQNPQPTISWIQHMRLLRHLIKECENSSLPNAFSSTWKCLKLTTLNIIDDMTKRQIIPVWPGVRLIQRSDVKESKDSAGINVNNFWQRTDLQYLTWFDRLVLSFTKMLNTHMLQINLRELTESYLDSSRKKDATLSNSTDPIGTARHRRHRFNMMITMMFGVTAFGAVIVPMGFQMLSIVSGKALLLAKMALLLASINGLKRVANTGVHYGLYHAPGEHYGHYYDRGDIHHPRNVQNLTPIGQPVNVDLDV